MKTSDISDERPDARVCELNFISAGRKRSFSGSIRTVKCVEGIATLREFIRQSGAGQVLVIDGASLPWRALFGDRMAEVVVRNGWEGVIVNGHIRDRAELEAMDIGVKALGTMPRRGDTAGGGVVDVPVQFGGVTFEVGSQVVADEDGVLVLPRGVPA